MKLVWKARLRLFIIESPNPMDLLQGRSEQQALEKVCTLIGHEVITFQAKSKNEFSSICKYISSIDSNHDGRHRKKTPLCIHISAHGNENGLAFGRDSVSWETLFKLVQPLCEPLECYDGDRIFVLSACMAEHQKLTDKIKEAFQNSSILHPPMYLFCTADTNVAWDDALISWAVFYHQLPKVTLDNKMEIQAILNRVKETGAAKLRYYRWDGDKEKYLSYNPK